MQEDEGKKKKNDRVWALGTIDGPKCHGLRRLAAWALSGGRFALTLCWSFQFFALSCHLKYNS
jgi:hypothetical protein